MNGIKTTPLALKASKLPIFQMFLFARKEYATVTPLKTGGCRINFLDNSSLVLLQDGSVVFEYVIMHIKYDHLTPLFFRANDEKQAVRQYLDVHSWMREHDLRIGNLSY